MTRSLKDEIGELREKFEETTPRKNTLEVLSEVDRTGNLNEDMTRNLLFYLLDPQETHGLEGELLDYLLDSINTHIDFDHEYSLSELNGTQIQTDCGTDNIDEDKNESIKFPDVVMWNDSNFFICWELKISAAESYYDEEDRYQTEKYAAAEKFNIYPDKDNGWKNVDSIPNEDRHYIYLSLQEKDTAESDDFNPISWEWVTDKLQEWLEEVIEECEEYPPETLLLVDRLINSLQRQINRDKINKRKVNILVEYYNEIKQIRDSVK